MDVRIELKYNYGYTWFSGNGIWVKGFVYGKQDEVLRDEALVAFFGDVTTAEEFKNKLVQANGLFSVIIQKEHQAFFAVDRTRTFPLFYALQHGKLTISDAAEACSEEPLQLSQPSKEEFLLTGYVTGSRTLLQGVSQVQAGEYICCTDQLQVRYYHVYAADNLNPEPFAALAGQLTHLFEEVGKRLVKALNGRTAVLPLSGGYDSRLIAVLLKKLRYPKVICFTYGIPSSPDVRLSQKVAKKLGFPWHFIPYNASLIDNFPVSKAFHTYLPFAANYTSMFFTQDYFAVKELKEKKIVPADSVFVPGHTGDFIAGGHLVPGLTQHNVAEAILKRHYVLRKGNSKSFRQQVNMLPQALPFESFENWNMKERQAKFIINSDRIYEFWGFEHLIPLWDKELVLFFQNIGLEHKTGRKLFDHVLFHSFFIPAGIAYYKENYPLVIQKMIGARNRMHRALFSDQNNFKLIARRFLDNIPVSVAWSSKNININSIQTAWYIAWLERHQQSGRT